MRCAWAKFKKLSPILTARGASRRMKGKIYEACVQSVLIYGTETWTMKIANLQSLERTERMMVRWMCGMSLKDRKRSQFNSIQQSLGQALPYRKLHYGSALYSEWLVFMDMWRGLISGKTTDPRRAWKKQTF